MRSIQGFYRVPSLADNTIGSVATFGELDQQQITYSTEERNYSYPDVYPNTELVTMQAVDELSQPVVVPDSTMKSIVSIGEWIVTQHKSGLIPADAQRSNFYAALQTQFGNVTWISMGALIRSAQNTYYAPTYVEFTITDSSYTYYVKVWLAAANFETEYGPYKTIIIPPVDDLSQFINNLTTVTGILGNNTISKTIAKYNAVRQSYPETSFSTYDLVWHDPNDSTSRIVTTFSYIAYGIAGTYVDNIKTAIREYLTQNSTYTKWNQIFPSLYEEADFTIIPIWDNIAVPSTQVDNNLYASYITVNNLTNIAYNFTPTSYGTSDVIKAHIAKNMELVSTFYRGMILASVANPNNQNSIVKLSLMYPDYTDTPTNTSDYERMQPSTRTFIETLNAGLEIARTLKESDTVPSGYYRTRRNNMVYVTFSYLDYEHMILTRDSYFAGISKVTSN